MRVKKSKCAIDGTDSLSTPCSNASGRSGRRLRLVSRAKGKAGQKSASSSGRRLSNVLDKYQCEEDYPPAGGEANEGVEVRRPSNGTLVSATPDLNQPSDEAFVEERSITTARPCTRPIQWPDEAMRKKVESKKKVKHIHPCICDLSKRQRANIEQFLKERQEAQQRYERRVQEIEEEIRLAEEAEQQRLRELEAEKEFYGDEYEIEGLKRKRKKRSARRASMVSLGVKQVINWRKPPKIEVRFTRTSNLRMPSATYCKPPLPPLPEIRPVDIDFEAPEIPIRTNRAVELRLKFIKSHIKMLQKQEIKVKYPDRPPFVTQYYW